jgi:hypothetical protein
MHCDHRLSERSCLLAIISPIAASGAPARLNLTMEPRDQAHMAATSCNVRFFFLEGTKE